MVHQSELVGLEAGVLDSLQSAGDTQGTMQPSSAPTAASGAAAWHCPYMADVLQQVPAAACYSKSRAADSCMGS